MQEFSREVKNLIIDTDTGSDDAVALIMALRDPSIKVQAITTVAGNVDVHQATYNALQSIAFAKTYQPPVFQGSEKPIIGTLQDARQVYGQNGMGDTKFKAPTQKAENEHAVDALIRLLGNCKDDIEMLCLGPLTNLGIAMMQNPDAIRKITHLTIMGGAFFYSNPYTVSAEFNIMVDPEAASIVFGFGIPITLVTLDACQSEDAKLNSEDINHFRSLGELGAFCMDCNRTAIATVKKASGIEELELPDPVAFTVFSKPDVIKSSFDSETIIELGGVYTRGTTIFRLRKGFFESRELKVNSKVVSQIYGKEFKEFLYQLIK